jgi:hypothetical protein
LAKNSMPGADEGNFLPAIAGVWPGTVDSAWRKKRRPSLVGGLELFIFFHMLGTIIRFD